MGSATSQICRDCGEHFMARDGGGFMFDLLHCDTCGAGRSVSREELGDIHLGFVKGLPGPYTVARSRMTRRSRPRTRARLSPGGVPGRRRGHARALRVRRHATATTSRRAAPVPLDADRWDEDPHGPMMFID